MSYVFAVQVSQLFIYHALQVTSHCVLVDAGHVATTVRALFGVSILPAVLNPAHVVEFAIAVELH